MQVHLASQLELQRVDLEVELDLEAKLELEKKSWDLYVATYRRYRQAVRQRGSSFCVHRLSGLEGRRKARAKIRLHSQHLPAKRSDRPPHARSHGAPVEGRRSKGVRT